MLGLDNQNFFSLDLSDALGVYFWWAQTVADAAESRKWNV